MSRSEPDEHPYGSWPTPLTSDRILSSALRLGRAQLDGGWLYWLEGRPAEGGRQVLVRARPGEAPVDVTGPEENVRSLVHEYGGGEFRVRDGRVVYTDCSTGRVVARDTRGSHPASATIETAAGTRHADFAFSPDGRLVAAVEEAHAEGREPENRIVCLGAEPDAGPGPGVVARGHDFYSFPRFAPDGSALVYTAWDHPNMPWDETVLYWLPWGPEGPAGDPIRIAGGEGESIFQPGFSPDGVLTFATDASGFWNLVRLEGGPGGRLRPVREEEAEYGRAQWVFGMSSWSYASARELLCVVSEQGFDRLVRIDVESGAREPVELSDSNIVGLEVDGDIACYTGGGPARATAIVRLDLASGRSDRVREAFALDVAPEVFSRPEPISFPTGDGETAHAFFYPPTNPECRAPEGERPPLLVKSHGGPTSMTVPVLNLSIQYWTSRGFAVVDVNYRGSSGYGREYRDALQGRWGEVDVEDCVNAARFLADAGRVDPDRLAISGGSAGGYTTLCALTFHDVFAAGASHYGIGDLEALARDTHKFEARYLDGLVGPWPEQAERYRARSPIHHTERLSCPVIFFQGLEDKVVPPNQAEAMVAALGERGIAYAHVTFPGEQHGFRRAENIQTALEGELYFYSRIFGFETDVAPGRVEIVGLEDA